MDERARLRDTLGAFAAVLPGFDQRDALHEVQGWIDALDARPAETALAVLRAFEGKQGLLVASLTRGGDPYRAGSDEDFAALMREGRLRSEIYDAALAVWLAAAPPRAPPPDEVCKLLDYGYGSEVWAVRGGLFASCDVGHLMSAWRRDEITPAEAAQASLGPEHFSRMILGVQARLRAAGVDPHAGDPRGVADPV